MVRFLTYNINRCGSLSINKCVKDILKLEADVIALQEVILDKSNKHLSKLIVDKLKGNYIFYTTLKISNKSNYGITIISKYPIKDNFYYLYEYQDSEKRVIIGAKIKIKSKIYWILNTHLHYETKTNNKQLTELYDLVGKLNRKNLILMGDLNITPNNKSLKNLYDFFHTYKLENNTFSNKILDYILVSKNIKSKFNIETIDYKVSDHKPVILDIKL